MTSLPRRPLRPLAFTAAFVFLYLRTFLLPATPFFIGGDQTLFFVRAQRILHGQLPYRDFLEIVTPATSLLYAAVFRLFGIHAWLLAAWPIALGLALYWITTRIARRLLGDVPMALLPGLLVLVLDYNNALDATHHWYSTVAVLAAAEALMAGITIRRIPAAGALCGLATLFTQTQGILALLAIFVWLLSQTGPARKSLRQTLTALLLPFLLVVAPVIGYFTLRAGPRTVFTDLVLFAPRYMSTAQVNSPSTYLRDLPSLHSLVDAAHLAPILFIYALVPYIYLLIFLRLQSKSKPLSAQTRQVILLLNFAGLALFAAVAAGPRYHRLCMVAPPAILLLVWLLSEAGPARKLLRQALTLASAFLLLASPLVRQLHHPVTLDLPIGRTVFSDSRQPQELEWLAQHTHPGDTFFNQPLLGLYLSLANPTTADLINDDEYTRPQQVATTIAALQHNPPQYILLQPLPADLTHTNSLPFRRFVADHYRLAQTFTIPADAGKTRSEQIWELQSTP